MAKQSELKFQGGPWRRINNITKAYHYILHQGMRSDILAASQIVETTCKRLDRIASKIPSKNPNIEYCKQRSG